MLKGLDLRDPLDQLVLLDLQGDQQVRLVSLARLVLLDQLDLKDLLVQLVLPVQ
jgi:hypothetical protein